MSSGIDNGPTHTNAPMSDALERLCVYFDSELTRQRAVLEACKKQGEAIRSHDIPALESASRSLVSLMEDALDAEKERLHILHEVVSPLGLEADRQTLSDLISVSPEPWSARMRSFQVELREILGATRIEVRRHAGFLRRAGKVLERSMSAIVGVTSARGDAYDREGKEPAPGHRMPALVNTLG